LIRSPIRPFNSRYIFTKWCLKQVKHNQYSSHVHILSILLVCGHLFDVGNDDGNDEIGNGDGDEEDEGDEEELDEPVAAPHAPHRVEGEVVVEVVLARHHVDHLEEGGEGVVEDVVLT